MATTVNTEEKNTYIGQCKWFNDKCGYGFISYSTEGNLKEPNKDIFVHYTNIRPKEDSEYKILQSGEYVQFEIKEIADESNGHKEQAINITGINGGHLFNEYRNSLRKSISGFDSYKGKFGGYNKSSYSNMYKGNQGRVNFNKSYENKFKSNQEWNPK